MVSGENVEPAVDGFANLTGKGEALNRRPEGIPAYVLIVEDSMMVALDTSDMLKKMGVEIVEAVATVAKALSVLHSAPPNFAVLDVSLRKTTNFEVAETLQSMDIPFCFVTGFGSDLDVPESLGSEIILTNPVNSKRLRATMTKLILQVK